MKQADSPAGSPGSAVDLDPGDELIHDLLGRLVRSAWRMQIGVTDFDDLGEPLTLSEGFALIELTGPAELSQQDLVLQLGLEKSTVSRLVAGLERRGLVSRTRRPSNQRFVQVELTDRGMAVARRVEATHRRRHQQLLRGLTKDQVAALRVGMAALVPGMEGAAAPR